MERMVNNRLVWFLERNKTNSSSVRFSQTTQHYRPPCTFGIFYYRSFYWTATRRCRIFDLEKAYDCTWKYGIIKDRHQAGLPGSLPGFIEGFFKIDSLQSA